MSAATKAAMDAAIAAHVELGSLTRSGDVVDFVCLVFDGSSVAEGGVSALTVVEDLDVLEAPVRELDSRLPLFPVQQLDLHR